MRGDVTSTWACAQSCDGCQPTGRFDRLIQVTARAVVELLQPAVVTMTFLQKLFSKKSEPKQRIRVCIECGMPIADHKEWCSILRGQQEMDRKARARAEVQLNLTNTSG